MNLRAGVSREQLVRATRRLKGFGRSESAERLERDANDLTILDEARLARIFLARSHGVSIVPPTFLGASRIRRTLDSLAAQTAARDRFETIIASNKPTDGTEGIVADSHSEHADLRVHFLLSERPGPPRRAIKGC